MKKHNLVEAVSRSTGVKQAVVRQVLDATASAVTRALAAGGDVFLFGLGKLEVSHRGEKVARNIRTGERVVVPPRRVAVYKQSTSVEHALNHDTAVAAPQEEAPAR